MESCINLWDQMGPNLHHKSSLFVLGFYFSRGFAARSRALRARISLLRRSCAQLDKTAMLRRLVLD